MANCVVCGKQFGFWSGDEHRRCPDCIKADAWPDGPNGTKAPTKDDRRATEDLESVINAILLTTETAPNLPITRRIEVITAEVAYGMHLFKDLFAGVRNVVGGRSNAVQQSMTDARRTALFELKREAHEVGANAVVGVDLDYVELAGSGSTMVMLVASGTAVILET